MRPITSRIELSATAFTTTSGLRTLNRYATASLIFQNTAKLMSMMFSSPVSIRLSSGTLRRFSDRVSFWTAASER